MVQEWHPVHAVPNDAVSSRAVPWRLRGCSYWSLPCVLWARLCPLHNGGGALQCRQLRVDLQCEIAPRILSGSEYVILFVLACFRTRAFLYDVEVSTCVSISHGDPVRFGHVISNVSQANGILNNSWWNPITPATTPAPAPTPAGSNGSSVNSSSSNGNETSGNATRRLLQADNSTSNASADSW